MRGRPKLDIGFGFLVCASDQTNVPFTACCTLLFCLFHMLEHSLDVFEKLVPADASQNCCHETHAKDILAVCVYFIDESNQVPREQNTFTPIHSSVDNALVICL